MLTEEQIKKRIEELKAQREQVIGQVNVLNGAIMVLEEVLAPTPPATDNGE